MAMCYTAATSLAFAPSQASGLQGELVRPRLPSGRRPRSPRTAPLSRRRARRAVSVRRQPLLFGASAPPRASGSVCWAWLEREISQAGQGGATAEWVLLFFCAS